MAQELSTDFMLTICRTVFSLFLQCSVSERLLEANKRDMWNTDAETLRRIQMIYMQAEGAIEEVSE